MTKKFDNIALAACAVALFSGVMGHFAFAASTPTREAAFVQPAKGLTPKGDSNQSMRADPVETDVGETSVRVTKRATIFFTNSGSEEVQIKETKINADDNVAVEVAANDCQQMGKIAPNDRCAITLVIKPISGGAWTSEVLLSHTGAGRVAKANLIGNTLGSKP